MIPASTWRFLPLASAIAGLLAGSQAQAAELYWDADGATPGAGGAAPDGIWSAPGTFWSTDRNGTLASPGTTTSLLDDLFFSAGVNATGAYTITLDDAQATKSLTFRSGIATISGTGGGVIQLGGTGIIQVTNNLIGIPNTAIIGAATQTIIGGSAGLTKTGVGALTLNGTAANTFTGGLHLHGGILVLDFANLASSTHLIDPANALTIGGSGRLLITGKITGTSSQTLGNVTVASGGGQLLGNRNGGDALNLTLGSLTASADGGGLLVGTAIGGTNPVITTTTAKDSTGIYGGRVVLSNGTAHTGYDWATSATANPGPYTISSYGGYAALAPGAGADTSNSRITASVTMTGSRTTNSLKFQSPATAQILDLGGNTLTPTGGGLLFTGNAVTQGPRITNGFLTAGADSNYHLVVHQYQANNHTTVDTVVQTYPFSVNNNTSIAANISDNGPNPVTLVKAGTGALMLTGDNSFTGGIVINDGGAFGWSGTATNPLNNNSLTFNANTILLANSIQTTTGGIALNNGCQVEMRNNFNSNTDARTFTVEGPVTGDGGITLGHADGYAARLWLYSTENTFTGPIRFASTLGSNNGDMNSIRVASLADSATYGEGNLTFGLGNTLRTQALEFVDTAIAPIVLNNRQIELTGTGNNIVHIRNYSAQALTINSDLLASFAGDAPKTLDLGGTGTGISTFAGAIPKGTDTSVLQIVKRDSGTWVLSGDSSYNGRTTIYDGILSINSIGNIGGGSSALGNPDPAGDDAGKITLGDVNSGTLIYTGDGDTTDRTIQINFRRSLAHTGGAIILNNGTGPLNFTAPVFNPTYASGVVVTRSLTLGGSNGGIIQGILQDHSSTNKNAVIKEGAGTWTLGGNNTYTGDTTVNAGKLFINGSQPTATGPVSVAAMATLGGTGTIGGNATIANNGKLEFHISTPAASHDKFDLATGKSLTFSGASVLTITTTGGAPGSYVLVTAPGGITGPLPATLNLPAGWVATVTRENGGTHLVLNLIATDGSAWDAWRAVNAPGSNPHDDTDGDGVTNAVEFVLGGNSTTKDLDKLPLLAADGTHVTFTFVRAQNSIDPETALWIETGTDLATWDSAPSPYTVPDGASADPPVTVVKDSPEAGKDTVTLTVPQDSSQKFARLKVLITP